MADPEQKDAPMTDEQIEGLVTIVRLAEVMAGVLGIKVSEALRAQLKAMQMMQQDGGNKLFAELMKMSSAGTKPS